MCAWRDKKKYQIEEEKERKKKKKKKRRGRKYIHSQGRCVINVRRRKKKNILFLIKSPFSFDQSKFLDQVMNCLKKEEGYFLEQSKWKKEIRRTISFFLLFVNVGQEKRERKKEKKKGK